MATTEAELKELQRQFTKQVLNDGNLDVIDELIAEEYVGHNPGGEDIHGPEELKEFFKMYRAAFPDLEVTTQDLLAEGNKTVQRNILTGTHEGELMGIPPTGETVEVETMGISRWEDGQGVEHWSQVDMMGLMEQLGVQ